MTQHPEMRYRCDRCGKEDIVPLQNVPAGQRASGPSGWMMLTTSLDPTVPSLHLCGPCRTQFDFFMGNHT